MRRVERGIGLGGWKATEGMGDAREGSWVLHKRLTIASGQNAMLLLLTLLLLTLLLLMCLCRYSHRSNYLHAMVLVQPDNW